MSCHSHHPDTIIIGTRGSELALWQAYHVRDLLRQHYPALAIELQIIKTTGDKILDSALSKIGDKGLFTREIETELLAGTIDLAVHSLKDLPTVLPYGLTIAAITRRANVNDVLISKNNLALEAIPAGATVLTGSLRRRAQLLNLRSDLQVTDIRGNVPTRLKKLADSDAQAMILAEAGLVRLNLQQQISFRLDPQLFIPAVGQGALAIETRADDNAIQNRVTPLHHYPTAQCCRAERALLHALEGGCQIPAGAYAWESEGKLHLTAMIASLDGRTLYKTSVDSPIDVPDNLGRQAAENLLNQGGRAILQQIRYNTL